ncbi:hypothetical protein CDAR_272051 [Caerostris darwini]|uniref:Uncharacterized protein n=1 Tax=Caerostris darwini TaxID=1538125 RepID=A0AAV4WCV7_9ARAC|nr:hypothetical protein CDAR_272051 [Caerostris darwini]
MLSNIEILESKSLELCNDLIDGNEFRDAYSHALYFPKCHSQSSSGPPVVDLHEQGITPVDDPPSMMDVTMTVTRGHIRDNNFLANHPAPHRLTDPTMEHPPFFEELLKEAASLML